MWGPDMSQWCQSQSVILELRVIPNKVISSVKPDHYDDADDDNDDHYDRDDHYDDDNDNDDDDDNHHHDDDDDDANQHRQT